MRAFKPAVMLLGVAVVLALGACKTRPIYSINDAAVVSATGKSLEMSQVRTAIINAGVPLGWQIVEISPGVLQGTFRLQNHTAVVDIPYSTTKYSILYKSSMNLDEKSGQIHKGYNVWVQNLDKAISATLAHL
jgi:hypothetical protein